MNRTARRSALSAARKRMSWDWQERVITQDDREKYPAIRDIMLAFFNDVYSVQIYKVRTEIGVVAHAIIRGQHGNQEPPWRDMQRIKNELFGEDMEAVQVFPKQADLMDQADVYHLWVLPSAWEIPFGLHRENGLRRSAR